MKRILLLFMCALSLVACANKSVEISVSNTSNIKRTNEIVNFCLCSVKKKLGMKSNDKIIILNSKGVQQPYQILSDGKTVLFPATVDANAQSIYKVMIGNPIKMTSKTFGRKVPERKDDFAWENDRIAFRMYGPALKPENPSNGVDVWLKRTKDLIINKFYDDDLHHNKPYHIDHGEGLDCYKVAHTLGAGGVAPYTIKDSSLWIGSHYNSCKVLESGPLRTVFQLNYDTLRIANQTIKETLTVIIDAGSQLNKAIVEYKGLKNNISIATGIFLHDSIDNKLVDLNNGIIGYAEKAVSDDGVPSGRMYEGVFVPGRVNASFIQKKHLLIISPYENGEKFTYYFGAGWNKWGFNSDNDWFAYLKTFSQIKKRPLRVTVK